MITPEIYHQARKQLFDSPEYIIETEKKYMLFLEGVVGNAASQIAEDFNQAIKLLPFWIRYAPIQRGRSPSGASIPWSEVGETAIGANIINSIALTDSTIQFPGLPSGADVRFSTDDALVHFDVKVTGPNDRADEVVASPNQISGDGIIWDNGAINSPINIVGQRATMLFQPELPPFYILDNKILLCLTYFLKGVYIVEQLGYQPLDHLELICVPNGLLTFDGLRYMDVRGLFIPGKDEKTHNKKRARVRMTPLAQIAQWRRKLIWSKTNNL